jgi:putative hemolysin
MEVLVLVGLIILNGIFAMSEIAIVTARKSRLVAMAQRGNSSASIALKLSENPTQFLSTVQIGITSIGILNGIYGEAILAEPFSLWLQDWGMNAEASSILSTVLVVVSVTYFSIVIGELVPKRIGQVNAETIACLLAKPMLMLAIITKPFVWLLSGSTLAFMRIFGLSHTTDDNVTHEDIQAMLKEGSSSGAIEDSEHAMVKNVFRLDERSIASLMVPRSDVVFLDVSLSLAENLQKVLESPHSRFPVCRQSVDDVIGIISSKQLLAESIAGHTIDLQVLAQPCHYVPESLSAMELIEHFRSSGTQMVFVIDEYGDFKGIVTLQDLMDVVTGEFTPDADLMIIQREDGSYLLDGLLSVIDLKDCLRLETLPEEDSKSYETLNGLVMFLLGKMPKTGDIIHLGEWQLEIVDMDGKRIDKMLATRWQGSALTIDNHKLDE